MVTSNDASSENPDKPDGQTKTLPKGFISAMVDKQLTQSGDGPQRLGEGGQKLTYQTVTNFLSSSSDLASSTSFFDDEETENDLERKNDTYYDYDENLTEYSSILSSQQNSRLKIRKKPQRRKKRPPQQMSRTSSYSSITDSTMSLNIITVQINMDTVNFLGNLSSYNDLILFSIYSIIDILSITLKVYQLLVNQIVVVMVASM